MRPVFEYGKSGPCKSLDPSNRMRGQRFSPDSTRKECLVICSVRTVARQPAVTLTILRGTPLTSWIVARLSRETIRPVSVGIAGGYDVIEDRIQRCRIEDNGGGGHDVQTAALADAGAAGAEVVRTAGPAKSLVAAHRVAGQRHAAAADVQRAAQTVASVAGVGGAFAPIMELQGAAVDQGGVRREIDRVQCQRAAVGAVAGAAVYPGGVSGQGIDGTRR